MLILNAYGELKDSACHNDLSSQKQTSRRWSQINERDVCLQIIRKRRFWDFLTKRPPKVSFLCMGVEIGDSQGNQHLDD